LVVNTLENFQGIHILGASRGHLSDSVIFLYNIAPLQAIIAGNAGFYSASVWLAMQSAVLAMIDSVCPSDRPTVHHTLVSCQNDSSYDYAVFTGG